MFVRGMKSRMLRIVYFKYSGCWGGVKSEVKERGQALWMNGEMTTPRMTIYSTDQHTEAQLQVVVSLEIKSLRNGTAIVSGTAERNADANASL